MPPCPVRPQSGPAPIHSVPQHDHRWPVLRIERPRRAETLDPTSDKGELRYRQNHVIQNPEIEDAGHTRSTMNHMPAHLSIAALKFLRGLKRNNDRIWFEERREIYERELKAPMLAIIGEVNEAMLAFAPQHIRPPQKAMMRIYRDIRFSKDKRPYKVHAAAWWSRAGLEKTSGGGFYFDVNPTEITVAAGVYMPEREQLLAIRRHLAHAGAGRHAEYRNLLAAPRLRKLMLPIDGQPLTRAPKGFLPDDPAIDLVLCRQWGVTSTLPAEHATRPSLVGEILERFRVAAPIVDLLNEPLTGARKRPMF